jgi:hypothetical protein
VIGSGSETTLNIHGAAGVNTVVLRGSGWYGLPDFVAHNALVPTPLT